MLKNKDKSGTITTEAAIGIALAVVVLFVVIELFNNNLSNMLTNSNLSHIFNNNIPKEHYDNFNRNYSQSQIEVQIMGEQGLEMLRRKANNKALELIESKFDPANPSGNSIAYLASMINLIVGKPDICVQMIKDSDKFCDQDSIGGYDYTIGLSSSALTINKVNTAGTEVSQTIALPIDSSVGSALNSSMSPSSTMYNNSTSGSRNSSTTDRKYECIKNLSSKLKHLKQFDSSVLLITSKTDSNK